MDAFSSKRGVGKLSCSLEPSLSTPEFCQCSLQTPSSRLYPEFAIEESKGLINNFIHAETCYVTVKIILILRLGVGIT